MTSPSSKIAPPVVAERTRWAPVVALALAMLAVTSEMSIPAVALPSIGAELGVGPAATAWVLLAVALPMAAISIPAGRWVDRADPRQVFLLSMIGVGVTSVLSAVAPTMWALLAARLLLGLAGGLTLAVYLPVIAASVRPEQRGRAISSIVTIMTVGGMAGASIGGLLAGAFGWRAVFVMKLPLLAVVVWLAVRAFPRNGKGLPMPSGALLREALVLGGAVTAVLLAVGAVVERPVVAAGLAAAALVLGTWWVRLPSSRPVTGLLRGRAFGFTIAGSFLIFFNGALLLFLLPYLLADVLHRGPAAVGVLMLVDIGAMALVSPAAGWLADRYGPFPVATTGGALTVAATLVMLTLGGDASLLGLGCQLALMGLGVGLFNAPAITAIMAAAPSASTGTAGGVSATARTIAMTVAPAVTALCWSVAGGGLSGFRAGVVTLAIIEAAGVFALLVARADPSTARAAA